MASRSCMNVACGTSESIEWKKGWALRSGEFATLCDKCGHSYEQSSFCEVFHSTESGWRECTLCGKRLHCGCIASRFMMELLDNGGVNCINCAKNSVLHSIGTDEKCNGFGTSKIDNVGDLQMQSAEDGQLNGSVDKMTFMQLGNHTDRNELRHFLHSQDNGTRGSGKMKQEEVYPSIGETIRVLSSDFRRVADGSCEAAREDICKEHTRTKDMNESLAQTSLNMNLGSGSSTAFGGVTIDGSEHSKASSPFQQGLRSPHILPKHPRSVLATVLEANAGMVSQIRVARPPAEGRGRNQLLPRYWPRITEQELQQISGSSNSTVVPLFEKMLSASDAGRIGRLVLPKACAEAYFPPISQPEGLPIRIQDVKGKEWVFQFRFWPNNNSRMYVLEGVTPCIQSMQLQAGDTVTFSRMDPEGKLIMGFRRASNSAGMQDTHSSAIPNGGHSSETFFPGVFENLPISDYSGLLHSLKGSTDPHLNALSKHINSGSEDISWLKAERHDDGKEEGLLQPPAFVPERKRARNIGSKSKRLLIDSQDALELKLTWEEAQDLLRPPPSVKPSTVIVENHEFEEYDEPPVFGKKSIFVACSTGVTEQWSQCDSCSKWRRLPVDVLLSSKWTCAENMWDGRRNSCSAADELNPREQEDLLRLNKEFKRHRILNSHKGIQDQQSSGLDALANAAVLNVSEPAVTASVATTTRHPRHRPGCSCIVCIQPPSGKGKHKPTCTCTVCMTVKRRFKTLMMRKKKRQSEREAEIAQRNQLKWGPGNETEVVDTSSRRESPNLDTSENEARSANELEESSKIQIKLGETSKGHLDLNFRPDREELQVQSANGMSLISLVQVASLPLETYLQQNGLSSLISEPEASSATHLLPATDNEGEGPGMHDNDDDGNVISAAQEQESRCDEDCEPDQSQNQS